VAAQQAEIEVRLERYYLRENPLNFRFAFANHGPHVANGLTFKARPFQGHDVPVPPGGWGSVDGDRHAPVGHPPAARAPPSSAVQHHQGERDLVGRGHMGRRPWPWPWPWPS